MRTVWPDGCMHEGGPHRRLAGRPTPISIGEDECGVFGALVHRFAPKQCFIVGNAFGFSAAYIALAMRDSGADHVIAMDAETEGDGPQVANVARGLAKRLNVDLLKIKKGFSPQDTPGAVEAPAYDLVFIDGNHESPYVRNDLHGVMPYIHDDTVIVFHDFFFEGVRDGVAAALDIGLHCLWLPTSCEMVVATRSAKRFAELRALFPEGTDNPLQHRTSLAKNMLWWARAVGVHREVWVEKLTGVGPLRPAASR
ncbi:MAG TPA: class I SAM-dependent methyltransferase [Polyangiales bacterium]|nr:class I SAM-dependent methyltransferase [Polyangiales bacterium]